MTKTGRAIVLVLVLLAMALLFADLARIGARACRSRVPSRNVKP
jgi:hypothetical protein